MNEPSETRATIATLRGDMREGFATINGAINTLTAEVRRDRDDRARADAAHESVHLEHSRLIAQNAHDIEALNTWRTVQETTNSVSPSLTWGRLIREAKAWAAGIAIFGGTVAAFLALRH